MVNSCYLALEAEEPEASYGGVSAIASGRLVR